jgi:flagellar hook-associated protein 3 FlgL
MSSYLRTASANTFDASVRNISIRQSTLSNLQENLTSGKKVVRASDDPTGAANAERALTRINRIANDQRALESQRNSITMAESTLGDITDALQRFRELVINAGNGVNSSAERGSIAIELQGLRNQIVSLANSKDTNGLPLFSALGSALAPFVGPQATGGQQ